VVTEQAEGVGPESVHRRTKRTTGELGLYKIFVYFKAFMHEIILPFLPLRICIAHTIAILLHDYCALHYPLPTPLLYAVNHTKLELAISCKGQAVEELASKQQGGIYKYLNR